MADSSLAGVEVFEVRTVRCMSKALALALLAALGCSTSLAEPGAASGRVDLKRLSSGQNAFTYFSQLRQPERLVIRDAAAWTAAWLSIWPNGAPIAAPPDVDFTKDMVLFGALGARPSTGFAIRFDSAATGPNGLVVWAATISPGAHCANATVITSPIDIATIARFDGPVQFVDVPTVIDCQ